MRVTLHLTHHNVALEEEEPPNFEPFLSRHLQLNPRVQDVHSAGKSEAKSMKISEVIIYLTKCKDNLGDIELFYDNDDGKSSWVSEYNPIIRQKATWKDKKTKRYYLEQEAY